MINRKRTGKEVGAEYSKWWDKVWWNRHMSRCTDDHDPPTVGCDPARALEERYGREFLHPGDDIEWGITLGKMMALAWVLGMDWEEAGDT